MQCLEEIVDQSNQEHSISEKSLKATLSSHPKARETPPEPVFTPPQKAFSTYFCFPFHHTKISIVHTLIFFSFYTGNQEKFRGRNNIKIC